MKQYAIGFDYGGVIGGGKKIGNDFSISIANTLGISIEEYRKIYFSKNYLINTGVVSSWREFWKILLKEIDKIGLLEKVMSITNETAKHLTDVDENILHYIADLRSRGYKVGLLSNATKDVGKLLRSNGIDKCFDSFLISADIGIQKPNPQSFYLLAKNLNVDINKLIFIDDAQISLNTAKECGFIPLLFKSFQQMKSELEKIIN